MVFHLPVPGADLSKSDGDAGPTDGLPPRSSLTFGSQPPSRVPGGPLSLFGAGGAGKCLLPAPPLPSHPPRVLCQEARGEPPLRQDQAGPGLLMETASAYRALLRA